MIEGSVGACLSLVVLNYKTFSFNFDNFFKFLETSSRLVQNRVQFHVDITHSPMLDNCIDKKFYIKSKLRFI